MSPRRSRSGTKIRASPTSGCGWSRRPSRAATSPACARRSTRSRPGSARLPGHVYANVRQPPVSTLNLAHMMPFSAVWAGPERDEHFEAPPLFFARTEGSTPFRFSLHVGDVGHTLIVGPTGAGKSRAAGADGAAVPPLCRRAGLRLRLRRLDPGGGARHGRRLARSRRRAGRRRRRAGRPAAARPRSTMPPSAPGRRNGSRPCSPAKRSPSRRKPRSISGRR